MQGSDRPWLRWLLTAAVVLATAAALWVGHRRHRQEQAAVAQPPGLLSAGAPGNGGAAPASPAAAPGPAEPIPPAPERPRLVVHVAGAVASPGIYALPEGARVADAVAAAGGALPEGLPHALNLAASLADGDKIYVPTREEVVEEQSLSPAAHGATHAPAGAAAAPGSGPGGRVSINRATAAELEAVPGIGPSTAEKIVQFRTEQGRFQQLEDLLRIPGIGEKKFDQMKGYLTL